MTAATAPLSPSMLKWLRLVKADTPSGGHHGTSYQPSLCALERRAYIERVFSRRTAKGFTWMITAAGEAQLAVEDR